jgi:hypothetical protein
MHTCADLKIESTALVPIDSTDRPLRVDRTEDTAVTLIPFLRKGLDQALEDDSQSEEHIEMSDEDDLGDVLE